MAHPSIRNHQHSVFSCVFKPYPSTMCSWEITLVIKHSLQPGQLKMNSFLQRWFEVKSENLQISLSRSVASASLWFPRAKSCACVQSVLVWNDLIYLAEFTQLAYWIICCVKGIVCSNMKILSSFILMCFGKKIIKTQKNVFNTDFSSCYFLYCDHGCQTSFLVNNLNFVI